MTVEARVILKDINRKYFDDNIDEMIWNSEHKGLLIIMKDKQMFRWQGDTAEAIYKQLVKNSMQ